MKLHRLPETLFEYYGQRGLFLPDIFDRKFTYEELKLGSANEYIGSKEQNIKLLTALLEIDCYNAGEILKKSKIKSL